jgi:hypothetical protein
MKKEKLRQLLQNLHDQKIDVDCAMGILKDFPYEELGFAKIDTHRSLRRGFPEVVFCQGKPIDQIVAIVCRLASSERTVMATRANEKIFKAIQAARGDAVFHESANIILVGEEPKHVTDKCIGIVSAGTSDIPVAEEAAVTAEVMGNPVVRLYDVGVAGIHRLLDNKDKLHAANVLIVVAGMEGALASVVGGLVNKPVIAVPTSVGYGASFNGLAPLLTMLNCCAPGVAVMNIDNGFGAGYFAGLVNLMGEHK